MGIVILSHDMGPGDQIDRESRERCDNAMSLYHMDPMADFLMPAGGFAQVSQGVPYAHSEIMRRYMLEQGVSSEDIISERTSLDTVGQVIFSRDLADSLNLEVDVFVTHDYHLERANEIFRFVYGRSVTGVGVSSNFGDSLDEREQRSLDIFNRTFDGIKPGDLRAIITRLYDPVKGHPWYARMQRK